MLFKDLNDGAHFISLECNRANKHEFIKLAIQPSVIKDFGSCECKMRSDYTWNSINESGRLVHFCNNVPVYQVN